MRILIANWHRNTVGGAESYLRALIPGLLERGHEVALVHGYQTTIDRETIDLPEHQLPRWCYEELGIQALLNGISQWKPEVVYSQGMESPDLELALLDDYPCVLFAHGYYGTCATGSKCHAWPHRTPCSRAFGPMCLILHYPRRCGGLNPLTTWNNYRQQAQRHGLLGRFKAVLVASRHMYREMENNGLDPNRLHLAPLPPTDMTPEVEAPAPRVPKGTILMLSRLTASKGGDYLIRAIPEASRKLNRPLQLVVAGSGSEESKLRALASKLGISAQFIGWVSGARRRDVIRNSDLVAFPSLWPEPFGLTGIEAASLGIPAVGFAVGGIPEWLHAGISGELAPGSPPTSDGLSQAIVRALENPKHYHDLSTGAWNLSRQFSLRMHLDKLEAVLSLAAETAPSAVPLS